LILRHKGGTGVSLTHIEVQPLEERTQQMHYWIQTTPLREDNATTWSTILQVTCNADNCKDEAVMTCLLAQRYAYPMTKGTRWHGMNMPTLMDNHYPYAT
jgi:hypothetical protein